MKWIVTSLVIGVLWMVAAFIAGDAGAQPSTENPGESQKGAEFLAQYQRWRQTKDLEERIELGEQLLALEQILTPWPMKASRERFKGQISRGLGYSYHARRQGVRADNLEKAIAGYEAALRAYSQQAFPKDWAWIQHNLGLAYSSRVHGDHADNLEESIARYQAALTVRTRDTFPNEWAETQDVLGTAFWNRYRGERAENLEKAIAHYAAALEVFTREESPREWAGVQHSLSATYGLRVRGDRGENLDRAIAAAEASLAIRTREGSPREWADTQYNIGLAYEIHVRGDRAENLDKAIGYLEASLTARTEGTADWADTKYALGRLYHARLNGIRADNLDGAMRHYEDALSFYRLETHREKRALTHHALAIVYANRVRGGRADNMEKAIAHFEALAAVQTREAFPTGWANVQHNLGLAYRNRVRGNRAENLEKAVTHAEAALSMRTREKDPIDWAATQNILGRIYWRRIRGDQTESKEKAIAHHLAALTVYTREGSPKEWAQTHYNLAGAYVWRGRGNAADNVEQRIAHHLAALTVWSREATPFEWARTQAALGQAYVERLLGERAENRKLAVAYLEAALSIDPSKSSQLDHLTTARGLGRLLLEAGEWERAARAYVVARQVFLQMFGEGLDEGDVSELIADAQVADLFGEAAFVAVQLGQTETALELANEGRARLLAVALKLNALPLAAEQRQRLEELSTVIRVEQQAVEDTEDPVARSAALDRLMAARSEVQLLVKSVKVEGVTTRAALAQAKAIVADGGALVMPVTASGTKMLIVTATGTGQSITVLDLPNLTYERMYTLLRGPKKTERAGWLGAYDVNSLPEDERTRRWPEWLRAIDEVGPALWNLFGGRLDHALRGRGLKAGARIVWAPSSLLGILPLGLAQDPVSKRRLADSYEIVYAPSLEALSAAQEQIAKAPTPTLVAIVNPTGDLPGTEKEASLISSHFPIERRTLLARETATPQAVLAELKGRTHWHFASHGTFSWTDARQSALVMHDAQLLTVEKLLRAERLGRPRLVVLSACETGLYEIGRDYGQFIGLPGAFMALGAAGVLGTLWPVSDDATALLMAKFYELHLGAGVAPPTALHQAQTWLRKGTSDEFLSYAKSAASQGRMQPRHLSELEAELSHEGLKRGRNHAVVEWTVRKSQPTGGKMNIGSKGLSARPYGHPYFWAGFIHTGL